VGFKQRLEGMPVIGTALAMQERYTLDGADPFAAAIGFFAFLSLFPLLALAVSVAGFVLEDPDDQVAVAGAITEAIPGFEATMQDGDVAALVQNVVEQRGTIGAVGIVLLLLSGLRVVNGAMIATRVVFRGEVQKGLIAKVRQVGALVGLGLLALAGVAGSSLAGVGVGQLPPAASVVLSLAITFGFDLLLFVAAFTLLSPTSTLTVRQLVPGAVLAAIGWTALKVAGASYVGNQVENANALYGALGGVIALMLLFYLAGRLYLYGAELNAVKVEREHGPLVAPTATTAATAGSADGAEGSAAGGPAAQSGARSSSRRAAAGRQGASENGAAPDTDGPPPVPRLALAPRPRDPGPAGQAPTIGADTHRQLAGADQRRATDAATRDAGADARHAVAIGLGLAALAAGYRFLRSDED
jgi:membrane protein